MANTSGLVYLQSLMFQQLHSAVLSAFVERQQHDTNTFHMPFREMTITLHDVELILGLSAYGTPFDTDHIREQLFGIINNDFVVRYTSAENDSLARGGIG